MPPGLTFVGDRATRWEIGLTALLFAVITLAAALQQEAQWWPLLEGDAFQYFDMTRQFDAGQTTVRATGPFVYRIAVPWVASFATWPQIDEYLPFLILNITSAFAVAMLLLVWLRRFVASPFVRVLMVAVFLFAWHGPARFTYFYPVYVDPPFMVAVMAALILLDSRETTAIRTTALVLVVFIGTLVRESMLLVAVAAMAAPGPLHAGAPWRTVARRLAPMAAAGAALAFTRSVGVLSAPYSPFSEPLAMLERKPVFTWVLGWFFTFGPPVVALIVANGRRFMEICRGRPHVALFFAGCLVASYVGGTDTERIAAWAAPVVYAAAGRSIERFATALGHVPLVVVLTVAQAVSARIFWPVPSMSYNVEPYAWSGGGVERIYEAFNRLVVIHTHYTYLWSYFGSRAWHAALLVYDAAFVGAIVVWIWMRDRRRVPAVMANSS
ncbi:MAG: hypothetical protein ACRD2N_11240 [Vicinamibacterales bacterium]